MKNLKFILIILFSVFSIIFIWFLSPWMCDIIFHCRSNIDPFVAIGSLFSGLAFVALVSTIIIQLHTLNSQKKEFQETLRVRSLNTLIRNQKEVIRLLGIDDIKKRTNITQDEIISIEDDMITYYRKLKEKIDKDLI
jgi:hypothetical protein